MDGKTTSLPFFRTSSPPTQSKNEKDNSCHFRISDLVVTILILGVGVAAAYTTYSLCGRIDAAAGAGGGILLLAGGCYILYRTYSSPKKGERDFINNAQIQAKIRNLEPPSEINDTNGMQILYYTRFEEHAGIEFRLKIDAPLIELLGLWPKYSVTACGETLYLSEVFMVEKQNGQTALSALAYVPLGIGYQKYALRLFCYSPTEGLWRVALRSNDFGLFLDSPLGCLKESTVVPFVEVGLALEALVATKQPLRLKGDVLDNCVFSYSERFQLSIPEHVENIGSEERDTKVPIKPGSLSTQISVLNRLFVSDLNSKDLSRVVVDSTYAPDFDKADFYPLSGPYFKEGFCVVVPSQDQTYRYVFFLTKVKLFNETTQQAIGEEKYAHPVLACVECIGGNQLLTTFGTSSRIVDTKRATTPAIDGALRVPDECKKTSSEVVDLRGNPLDLERQHLYFYPTWKDYRSKLPILQEFMQWLEKTFPE